MSHSPFYIHIKQDTVLSFCFEIITIIPSLNLLKVVAQTGNIPPFCARKTRYITPILNYHNQVR